MTDDIQEYVLATIAKEAGVDRDKITMDSTLKDLEISSLDATLIAFELEDRYKIQLPDRDPNTDTESVKGLIETVKDLVATKDANPPPVVGMQETAGSGTLPADHTRQA
jgi:acyl carrier protein